MDDTSTPKREWLPRGFRNRNGEPARRPDGKLKKLPLAQRRYGGPGSILTVHRAIGVDIVRSVQRVIAGRYPWNPTVRRAAEAARAQAAAAQEEAHA